MEMRKTRYTEEEIGSALKQAETGMAIARRRRMRSFHRKRADDRRVSAPRRVAASIKPESNR